MGMLLSAALLAVAPAAAADRVVSPTGAIHSITVENLSAAASAPSSGTRLVYRVQSCAEESIQSVVIPGTDTALNDTEPVILLSPITFRPVIVWTRSENSDAEIMYSFYNGSAWSTATLLTQNTTIDHHPQIFWGPSGYLHILWAGATTLDGPTMYEAVLDSKGFVTVPPAPVHTIAEDIVTTSTGAPTSLSVDGALFLLDTTSKVGTRVSAQGGYDEPIPVNQRTDFILPSGSTVESSRIEVVNGRILVLVRSGSSLYYSYESSGSGWTPLRSVTIDLTVDERAAENIIRTMIASLAP
jgi:hypothetical protein